MRLRSRRHRLGTRFVPLLFGALALFFGAFASHAEISSLPYAGNAATAFTLGKGGFLVGGGYMGFDTRQPRLNQTPIDQMLDIGGTLMEREVRYIGEGGLLPLLLGFGIGDTTDLYLSTTLSTGTSEKRIRNFYGRPIDVYLDSPARYDRVYEQPVFDVGIGLKYQVKPDLGDGLPAVAVGANGRFGYTADDIGGFKDTTPANGFPDFGLTAFLAVTEKLGDLLAVHGSFGLSASRKLGPQTTVGAGVEFALIPDRLIVSGDYATRRDIAGIEYRGTKDRATVGFRYSLAESTFVQLRVSPGGHLLVDFVQLGERHETVTPQAPSFEEGLF